MDLLERDVSGSKSQVVLKFVIGKASLDRDSLILLDQEQEEFGDILLLDVTDRDIPDPPPQGVSSATTLKVMYGMDWAVRNYEFDYFVRLGDDSYFRIDQMVKNSIKSWPREGMYRGFCHQSYSHPNINEGIPPNVAVFCGGRGYIVTYDVALFVSRNMDMLRKGYPEDTVVGSWFVGIMVDAVHDDDFYWLGVDNCDDIATDTTLLIHYVKTESQWNQIDINGTLQC